VTGSGDAEGSAIARDALGLVVAGVFDGIAVLGRSPNVEEIKTDDGNLDLFVARYDFDGDELSFAWAQTAGGERKEACHDAALLDDGSVLVAGDFEGPITQFGEVTLRTAGYKDGFLARYDAAGVPQWARRVGGAGPRDTVARVVVPSPEEAILAGSFEEELSVGVDPGGTTLLTAVGSSDAYLLRLHFAPSSE